MRNAKREISRLATASPSIGGHGDFVRWRRGQRTAAFAKATPKVFASGRRAKEDGFEVESQMQFVESLHR